MDEILKALDEWFDAQCVNMEELEGMFDEWCGEQDCSTCKYNMCEYGYTWAFYHWIKENFYILPKEGK